MTEMVGRVTALVADDSPGHRKVVEMLLSAHSYDVVAVVDGHEALTYLQAHTPHVAILDVNMPFMTGIEVCARVRRIARLRDLPIIIMTSMGDEATKAAAGSAGADLLIHKPLTGQSVPDMIRNARTAALERTSNWGDGDQASGDSPSSSSLL